MGLPRAPKRVPRGFRAVPKLPRHARAGWLDGWLEGWLAGWLLEGWLAGMAGGLAGRDGLPDGWLEGWLCTWLAGGLPAGGLGCQMAGWKAGWRDGWLEGLLADWMAGSLLHFLSVWGLALGSFSLILYRFPLFSWFLQVFLAF